MKALRIPALIVSLAVLFSFEAKAFAEDAVCVFLSNKDNAWVIRRDADGVKSSLKIGDPIYKGDTLVVTRGNQVQLAFDKDAQNVMQIEGDTQLQISRINPTDIELKQGKIFALLDKKGPESHFKVFAPTAIAAVRGTQFQVLARGNETQVLTYRGSVEVNGRDASGEATEVSVLLGPNQKTMTAQIGQAPAPSQFLNDSEKAEIGNVLGKVDATKAWIRSQGNDSWFESATKGSETKTETKTSSSDESNSDKNDPIVY